jgi:hypothetical protein
MAIAEHGTDVARIPVEPSTQFTITIPIQVYPQGGRWYAVSTEYVVMAEGRSEEEALKEFIAAASGYVASALAHGWMDALNRRPPLPRRLEIRARVKLARLLGQHPTAVRKRLAFDWTSLRLA